MSRARRSRSRHHALYGGIGAACLVLWMLALATALTLCGVVVKNRPTIYTGFESGFAKQALAEQSPPDDISSEILLALTIMVVLATLLGLGWIIFA